MKYSKSVVWDQMSAVDPTVLEAQVTESIELDDTVEAEKPLIELLMSTGPFATLRSDAVIAAQQGEDALIHHLK